MKKHIKNNNSASVYSLPNNRREVRLLAYSMTSAIALVSAASAQQTETHDFDIDAQPMDGALFEFSEEAKVQIVFEPQAAKEKRSPGVNGRHTVTDALGAVLEDSDLNYQFTSKDFVVVKDPSANKRFALAERSGGRTQLAQLQTVAAAQQSQAIARTTTTEEDSDRIVVTGSRIGRTGFDTPTPTTVINNQQIEQSGFVNLADVLIQTPAISAGANLSNTNNSGGDTGASFINLRGLGVDRTLVLVDGRRRVAGSRFASSVDLSAVPPSMVERVDIITGGASAVYGADAVTGVINVILKKDFEGLTASTRFGFPEHGGGAQTKSGSMHAGINFDDDRGNIGLGVSYTSSNILAARDRDFGRSDFQFLANPDDTGPGDGIAEQLPFRDASFHIAPFTGLFFLGGAPVTFDADGVRPSNFGDPVDFGRGISVNGDGFDTSRFNQLRAGLDTFATTTTFRYDIANNVEFYSLVDFSKTESLDRYQPTFDIGLEVLRDNPLLPAEITSAMDSFGQGSIFINRGHTDLGVRETRNERTSYTVAGGFRGTLLDNWAWDVFYQYGRLDLTTRSARQVIEDRFLQAIDAISGPDGSPVCRDPQARADGCLPYLPLGINGIGNTPETLDYFQHTMLQSLQNTQHLIGASVAGSLFELPAGEVQIAAGFEYREDKLSFREDGLNSISALRLTEPSASADEGFDVIEGYGEILVPLISDQPFFNNLEVEGAVRLSNYSSIGSTTTWKAAGSWSPVEGVRFRGTRSRSVRAPSIDEFFNPGSTGFVVVDDPCTALNQTLAPNRPANCAALLTPLGVADPANFVDPLAGSTRANRTGGNPNLDAETSNSWTVGMVLQPSVIPNLSISVDYWDISITGAINGPVIGDIVEGCVDSATIDNAFCSLITRDAGGSISEIRTQEINIGSLDAKGIDFAVNYGFNLDSVVSQIPGRVGVAVTGTYLDQHNELFDANDPDTLIIRAGEIGLPHWRGNLSTNYATGPFSASWRVRVFGTSSADNQQREEEFPEGFASIGKKLYNDVSFKFDVSEQISLNAGVNNLFDVKPPNHPNAFLGAGLYDNIGRFFFFGASVNL